MIKVPVFRVQQQQQEDRKPIFQDLESDDYKIAKFNCLSSVLFLWDKLDKGVIQLWLSDIILYFIQLSTFLISTGRQELSYPYKRIILFPECMIPLFYAC